MAISDRITSIEEHIKESYQELEGIGIDTTGVDKNLENIPKLIDGYWETLPKVTGEGTSITLDNTKEGKMKINLKGNTSQEGTPTPTSPQDIHVVSGDNVLSICGKNLLSLNNFTTTSQSGITLTPTFENGKLLYITSSGTYSGTVTYITLINTTNIKPSTQYRLSGAYSGSARLRLREFDSNNTQLSEYFDEGNGVNFTTKSNVHHIIVQCVFYATNNVNFYPMIVLGTTPTTYEPYIGNTYPVNLGVENYLPNNATTQTINGITYTINEDKSIKINGTASGRADIYLYGSNTDTGSYTYIPKGTYTIDTSNLLDGTMFLQFREKTAGVVYQTKQNNGLLTLLSQQDCYFYGIMLAVESGKTINNLTFYPQIEKGTKLNSYTPYGTTPIELCKIGNYQDIIKKSTGKNLFDKSMVFLNKMVTGTGSLIDFTGVFSSDYIKVQPNTAYYVNEYIPTIVAFDKDKSSLGYIRNASGSATFTTPNNCEYIRVRMFDASIDMTTALNNAMINEGSTALPYEPYGTGWYVKKEIGKTVITSFDSKSGTTNNIMYNTAVISDILKPPIGNVRIDTLSNYFESKSANQIYANNITGIGVNITGTLSCGFTLSSTLTTLELANTWVANNNITAYYPLATPTYIKITGELLSQLNALARSYTSQTNISQESNDLASLLNATALSE